MIYIHHSCVINALLVNQKWEDEGERQRILQEKHARGGAARSNREERIQQKEKRKMQRSTRLVNKLEFCSCRVASFHKEFSHALTCTQICNYHFILYQGHKKRASKQKTRTG